MAGHSCCHSDSTEGARQQSLEQGVAAWAAAQTITARAAAEPARSGSTQSSPVAKKKLHLRRIFYQRYNKPQSPDKVSHLGQPALFEKYSSVYKHAIELKQRLDNIKHNNGIYKAQTEDANIARSAAESRAASLKSLADEYLEKYKVQFDRSNAFRDAWIHESRDHGDTQVNLKAKIEALRKANITIQDKDRDIGDLQVQYNFLAANKDQIFTNLSYVQEQYTSTAIKLAAEKDRTVNLQQQLDVERERAADLLQQLDAERERAADYKASAEELEAWYQDGQAIIAGLREELQELQEAQQPSPWEGNTYSPTAATQ